jgi:hypothetical protein
MESLGVDMAASKAWLAASVMGAEKIGATEAVDDEPQRGMDGGMSSG